MEKIIKKVINTIEKNGFEAYIVGGYVRDMLLGNMSYDIDICTNALPKDLIGLFPNSHVGVYGAVDFKIKKFSFEITTYRKELKYENRRPTEVIYINNLLEDLQRRDFTINTFCMNQKENVIDLLDAKKDLDNHIIKCIGDEKTKIMEDPLRILRAIRFATLLNFKLDKNLYQVIYNNNSLVQTLSSKRIKEELDKILLSDNFKIGLNLLKELGLVEYLGMSYNDDIKKVNDINGMWAQINFQNSLAFTKESRHNISALKKILFKGKIDNEILYKHGLYLCSVASEILKIDRKVINTMYKNLPIYSVKDINVSTEKIIKYLDIKEGKKVGIILDDLVLQILTGKLKNEAKAIYNYLDKFKEENNEN